MSLSPLQSLILLLLLGLSIGGWVYGVHWKQVASGDKFSVDETLVIQLQDQIEVLNEKNSELNQLIHQLVAEEGEAPPKTKRAVSGSAANPALFEGPIQLPTR